MKNGWIGAASSNWWFGPADFFAAHSTFDKITTQACRLLPRCSSSGNFSKIFNSSNFRSISSCSSSWAFSTFFASTSSKNRLLKSIGSRSEYLFVTFSVRTFSDSYCKRITKTINNDDNCNENWFICLLLSIGLTIGLECSDKRLAADCCWSLHDSHNH